jgi:methylated-DNA-[protein]-cysteine S-methyltransferase
LANTIKLTDFQNLVYSCLKRVPKGRVVTYADLARMIGRPKSARAVGNALNKNPFAPIVPCHRVVASNGDIGGYAGGVPAKIKILQTEGITVCHGKINNFEKLRYIC